MSNFFSLENEIISDIPRLGANSNFQSYIDEDIIKSLNTYRNWGLFGLIPEVTTNDKDKFDADPNKYVINPYKNNSNVNASSAIGTKSLFNNVNAVSMTTNAQIDNNAPLLDSVEIRKEIRKRGDCSIRELVRASENNEMGRSIYKYADFMYCKHLGRVSNNYLVTLRRFPYPCGDHINFLYSNSLEKEINEHMPDVGRMVTWIGTPGNDMSNILKYSVNMPYEELSAKLEQVEGTAEKGGLLGSFMNMSSDDYVQKALGGVGGTTSIELSQRIASSTLGVFGKHGKTIGGSLGNIVKSPPESDWFFHIDQTKTYGNADVISKTHKRSDPMDGGGLQFSQEISLTFDYELRSYDGINGRAAFLDLIGNILSVTYANGKFWGGAYRGNGLSQLNAFTNLPLFKMLDPSSNNSEPFTWGGLLEKTMESVSSIGQQFTDKNGPIDSIGDAIKAIGRFANNMGKLLIGGSLNALGRPAKQGLNSLLNPAPVGLWHLTIGNPKHPIMSMGNMILTGVNIEHYGPLGFDDFPTGIKVEITLKHAKPRDAGGIENMYMMGDYRIYQPMNKHVLNMYKAAADYKSDDEKVATSSQINTPTTNDNLVETSDDVVKSLAKMKKYMMQEFGTNSQQNIIWAGAEAHLGSQKPKTFDEAKREAKTINSRQK